ncbi:MAG: tetratricopeptide repeat protein [Fibrobacteria bacterium]
MTKGLRSGFRIQAFWVATVLAALPVAGSEVPFLLAAVTSSASESGETSKADTNSLFLDIKPVLVRKYAGIDTAALLARIQERQKWGEKDDQLLEAEGIIHWDRGDIHLAVPCFKGLSHPGYLAMGFMGEALLARGEKYEAAGWFLKSAREAAQNDPFAISMYQRYLEVKPADVQSEIQLAAALESQLRYPEASAIYWKHLDLVVRNPQAALRIGALLASQGRSMDALTLYARTHALHPKEKGIVIRMAETHESQGHRVEAAQAWADAWAMAPIDTTLRNRAIAHLEASGSAGDAPLKALLENALKFDDASPSLHFKLALLALRADDRKAAYAHLDRALKASPGNPTYLARLPEAIEGDSLIQANFPALKGEYEKDGVSLKLIQLVARGFSLAGDKPRACRAWQQVAELAPRQVEGRRDAFLDLTSCGDPASLTLAASIGERYLSAGFNPEAARTMVHIELRAKAYGKASAHASRLVVESPSDAPIALAASKALLDAGRIDDAKPVLAAIGTYAPMPEAAMLLGRMRYQEKDFQGAAEQFLIARDSFPEAMRLRAACLAEMRNFASAAAEYQAHYARTGDKESLRALVRLYRELGFAPKEAEVLENLAEKGWAGDDEKLRLGNLKSALGSRKQALAIYTELFKNRTMLPAGEGWSEAAIFLGIQAAREGDLEMAIRSLALGLKSAPGKTPGLAEAWIRLGECLAEKKQWKDAWSAYGSALAIDSNNIEAAAERLQMAKAMDSKADIADGYRAVYRLDTNNDEANAYLAALRQTARDYREAAMHYRRVVQFHPTEAKAWENLGNALAMIPDLRAASGPLQTAIDLGAQSDEVYINRARAYRLEGSKDMATSILEFLLNRNPHDYLANLWSAKFAEEDGNPHKSLELFKKTSKLAAPRSSWPELVGEGHLEAKATTTE